MPLEELRTLAVALAHYDPGQAGPNQHLVPALVLGQETFLAVAVQLLGAHDVVHLSQLGRDGAQTGVLRDDRVCQGPYYTSGRGKRNQIWLEADTATVRYA